LTGTNRNRWFLAGLGTAGTLAAGAPQVVHMRPRRRVTLWHSVSVGVSLV
jgi:hypothetical protein